MKRSATAFILMLLMVPIPGTAETTDPTLLEVQQRIQAIKSPMVINATFSFTGSSVLVVDYLTQIFKVHPISMTGEISKDAHDQKGPSYKGYSLFIEVQPRGQVNQAVTPNTLRRPYWETYIQLTPVTFTDKQLYWGLSYGSRTDKEILSTIKNVIEGMK
jgi:hypothetical protein